MLVVCLIPSVARAQLCEGAASFKSAPLQIGSGLAFSSSARGFGGGIAVGQDALFVGATVGGQTIDNTTGTAVVFSGQVGSDIAVDAEKRVHFCPLGSVSYLSGPQIAGLDTSTVGVTGGGAIGIVAAKTPVAAIVPTFGLSGVYERVSVSSGSVSVSNSTNYGVASIGVGFVFTDQLALVPTVAVPFGLTGGNAEFVLTLSYNFRMR